MRLRPATAAWMITALVSGVVLWADPRRTTMERRRSASHERSLDRVFPECSGRARRSATLEFAGPKGPVIRLIPGTQGGHELVVDDKIWGPASEEAVENAWSNLRMARVIREVADTSDTQIGRWGAISLHIGDQSLVLRLGKQAADGAGVYAQRSMQQGPQVVDGELTALVDSPGELWLRRSMLSVDPAAVSRVQWANAPELARELDGRWRVQIDPEHRLLLSSAAVDLRLARVLHAPLRHLLPRAPAQVQELRAWLTVVDAQGTAHHVMAGGPCPKDPSMRVIDRGPGLLGCIDAKLTEAWSFTQAQGVGLVEMQLVPHRFGEWAGIEQKHPTGLALRKGPGRWEMATSEQTDRFSVVSESEVYSWYQRLGDLSIDFGAMDKVPASFTPSWTAQLHFDGGQGMQLACGVSAGQTYCRRDDGPVYPVQGRKLDELELSFDALADRQILSFPAGSVRSIELVDHLGSTPLRQSAYLDYGAWKLSAPDHPDHDGALDQLRLEELLGTLGSLRALAWVPFPKGPVQRSLILDYVPGPSAQRPGRIDLYAGCIVHLHQGSHQGKAARIDARSCQQLREGLLYDDPVGSLLRNATRVELELWGKKGMQRIRLQSTQGPGEGWRVEQGSAAQKAAMLDRVHAWIARKSQGLGTGDPPGPRIARLHIQRPKAPPVTLELGRRWAKIQGLDWWFHTGDGQRDR